MFVARRRWARHVARMEDRRRVYRDLVRGPERRNHLEDLIVDRIILEINLERSGVRRRGLY
jgi:hypothetical protein